MVASACATTSPAWRPPSALDNHDDPAALRPGYGNPGLHTWWPLTAPEVAAVNGAGAARQGDAHALLALAMLASGDARDAAPYASAQRRVDQFMSDVKPSIEAAPDEWHRGYELHRAMHRVFFRDDRGELGGYDFYQARVSAIFTGGHYNCLSSAMLFAVLARGFGLAARAVVVPTHVFIQIDVAGGKTIENETTSATGFDWVHDNRFYKEAAAQWSSNRGLRPVTLDEYRHRRILEPYQLMALAMRNAHAGESTLDRSRLDELAGVIDPDDAELQMVRMGTYINEANLLYDAKAWRTSVSLFDAIAPAVSEIGAKSKDSKTLELVSWAKWQYAHALMIVGRHDQAMALMSDGFDHLDASWPDAEKLKTNYLAVLTNRLGELLERKDYPGAVKVFKDHRDACRSFDVCAGNAGVVYGNWSIEYQNAGDWQSARRVLQECVAELPGESRCRTALTDLEGRHRF